jgi:glutathione S-transferase
MPGIPVLACLVANRAALAFKGLPFKTVWVEYPDIADACKKIGAAPTSTRDGEPLYTLPVIHDTSTGKVISNSWTIAEYLDETYSDRPALFPKGTRGLQWALIPTVATKALNDLVDIMIFPTYKQLRPRSYEYFRVTREKIYGCKMEEISAGEQRAKHWATVEAGFDYFVSVIKKNGPSSRYFLGDIVCYMDLLVAGFVLWVRQVEGGEEWEKIQRFNDGFWGEFVDSLTKYGVCDEGEEYQK